MSLQSSNEYMLGTTVVLQAVYYNSLSVPMDADVSPPVVAEIRDSKARLVQTGLVAQRQSQGTYQVKYKTSGLKEGTYYFVFTAYFDSLPDIKSGSFVLKQIMS